MLLLRPAAKRGVTRIGWLHSRHTFSFDQYYDPRHMGFRSLRVINEDRVAPQQGFPTHGHQDMEIITYVLEGALKHKDSMGNGSVIRPGEVQRMSAGTGITHSEYNDSSTEAVHFLQIWIRPSRKGIQPGYEQRDFSERLAGGQLIAVASGNGSADAVHIQQDAEVYAARIKPASTVVHELAPGRNAWVQVARGAVEVNGIKLSAGDGAAISEEPAVNLSSPAGCEVLLFDLA
ncbi:MAG: pirin family protein [Bryobacteraceae bacterium]